MNCKVIVGIKLKNAYKLQIRVLKVDFKNSSGEALMSLVLWAVFAVDVFEL